MGLEKLIPLINKLMTVFHTVDGAPPIELPQIVVVGSQSSGKSSVIENIVGRDFLPRGAGIVTRRPLILQLIHRTSDSSSESEWGEFDHVPDKKFFDFQEIKSEIERETDRVTGRTKAVAATPILLKIFSPNVLNLTLVDLPGITKVPLADQPADIERQIREMIEIYIKSPKALILAITPGNIDLANSDAIKLARKWDPEGDRTLGVITKLDLLDRGTDATDVLLNRVIPLKLGYVGVINRSQDPISPPASGHIVPCFIQSAFNHHPIITTHPPRPQDINTGKTIRDALEAEQRFFQTHPAYRSFADRCGTPFLAGTLNTLLIAHIRNCLPELRMRVQTQLAECQGQLCALGSELDGNKGQLCALGSELDGNKTALLLRLLNQFSANFCGAIEGSVSPKGTSELFGGARIMYIFRDMYCAHLGQLDPCDSMNDQEILTQVRNSQGPRAILFVPEACFEQIVKRQIEKLRNPSLRCLELIHTELLGLLKASPPEEMRRFPGLMEAVSRVAVELLARAFAPTREMILNLLSIELSYINTSHPDFPSLPEAMRAAQQQREQQQQLLQQQAGNPFDGAAPQQQQQQAVPPHPQAAATLPKGIKRVSAARETRTSAAILDHPIPAQLSAGRPSEEDRQVIELIKTLVRAYFNIVRKTISDTVPKVPATLMLLYLVPPSHPAHPPGAAIMHFMVDFSKANLQAELVKDLYKDERADELLQEHQGLAAQRIKIREMVSMLNRASAILDEAGTFDADEGLPIPSLPTPPATAGRPIPQPHLPPATASTAVASPQAQAQAAFLQRPASGVTRPGR
ncbi:dynamin-related protein [Paratrimastix pyriformis]|uniref:Dynamin-related protein n=1 Tax=Paratrimastix pyriformis TaxID=342808 RepID=A0ABQ8U805_9EUKA|nr:dynamin-related protein [Paratrimastix pyriformis]